MFALPFAVVATRPQPPALPAIIAALLVWSVSVLGEALADQQLARFRADPGNRGRTCRIGLWAWSRHPNYFFEWLHWFAYPLLAWGHPQWWLALSGPVLMLLFLYRLSGIPWTEAQSLRSRGEDYRRYQAEVSPFLPLPPRRG
jgi:steroid 5-alpha reductase family enzyme